MMFEGVKIESEKDLGNLDTPVLLRLHNKVTGKATKKFNTRSKGIAQTWKALQGAEPAPEPKGRRYGLSFRLPPREDAKEPRPGTKRRKAFELVTSEGGALFSQISKACEWERKDAYEGIRLLNTYCGFGLWHVEEGEDDYRIQVATPTKYRQLVERENTK